MANPPDTDTIAGIVIVDATDPRLPIVYASHGFELVTGYGATELLGHSPRLLQGPDTDPRAVASIRTAIAEGRDSYTTLLNYRADGTPFWNELSIAAERDENGAPVRWIGSVRDVTDRMRTAAKLHELSVYDRLTGLVNSEAMHDELRSALHRARVHDREAALLVIDIEEFAQVNREHGREVGDSILRAVADRLRNLVRPQDTLARFSGDEFVLLLADIPERAGDVATELAVRLQAALREPIGADALKIELRANIGIALFPGALTSPELLAHAEEAVDVARSGGRDYHLFEPRPARMIVTADAAFSPEAYGEELASILERGDIHCTLEPVFSLEGRDIVGYEALARGPEGSALHTPSRLRDCATQSGMLERLDWACRSAAVAAALDAGLPDGSTLFVNVTTATIGQPPPAQHDGSRYDLVLDLRIDDVESSATAALVGAAHWQAGGGRLAIDDLGAGTRALGLLPLLDPDIVKLDLTRIHRHAPSERARLTASVAALAERTGAVVMVEAIETCEDALAAQALGATLGSGRLMRDADPRAGGSVGPRPGDTPPPGDTPFSVLAAASAPINVEYAVAAGAMALAEQRAQHGDGIVLLATLPSAELLDADRCARLRSVARNSPLVALFGDGLGAEPVAGATGVQADPGEPAGDCWSLVVLGTDLAIAVAAQQRPDGRYRLARTTDATLVVAAARTLLTALTLPD